MVRVRAIHQDVHLTALFPTAFPLLCCRKCALGFFGRAHSDFTHDRDSHQKGRVLLQRKNRCAASSSELLHSGHNESLISTCLLLKFTFVGRRSLMSLHENTNALGGNFSFHNFPKTPLIDILPLDTRSCFKCHKQDY